jgi:hypothetical protein
LHGNTIHGARAPKGFFKVGGLNEQFHNE